MKNKKRILALFGVFLALMSVITPLCVSAAETEVTATAETITNLTNTTWYFLYGIEEIYSTVSFNINFTCNNVSYDKITLEMPQWGVFGNLIYSKGNENIYVYSFDAWDESHYRLITITGGDDVENPDLISWLETNGTQLKVTNLTDTTWTVASGWQAEAGYGLFDVDGRLADWNMVYLQIGYNYNDDDGRYAAANYLYSSLYQTSNKVIKTPSQSFTISFTTGTDTTNPKLIAWLSKYGELQGAEDPEPEPETDTFTFLTVGGDEFVYTYEVGMTWAEWAESEYNTFTNSYFFTVYTPSNNSVRVLADLFVTAFTHTSNGYRVVCYEPVDGGGDFVNNAAVVESRTYQATLLYDVGLAGYNSFNAGIDSVTLASKLAEYDGSFESLMTIVYDVGNNAVYNEYLENNEYWYDTGFNEASSKDFGKNLLGDTLNAPLDALNSIIIYRNGDVVISLGLVLGSMLALVLLIAFLKLFAGG